MSFEEFQDGCHGGHLGYRIGTILAILNLCVAPMPPIVLAQSDLRRCCLKNFKMAVMVAILDIGTIIAILNLYIAPMPPIKFRLNLTYVLGGDVA